MHAAPVEVEFLQKAPPVPEPSRWWWPRSWRGLATHAACLPVAVGAFLSICEALGWSQLWWGGFVQIALLLVGVAHAAVGALIVPFALQHAARLFVWGCVTSLFAFVALAVPFAVRTTVFERCAERAQPLVDAIERFTRERSAPPERLAELVPQFLAVVPGTGMPSYPEFVYHRGRGPDDLPTGGFELRVPCHLMWVAADLFVYWPSRAYPEHMYSGRTQRLRGWAYVHVD